MIDATIQIDMLSEWLIGGERDRSSGADVAQLRDRFGLPYIPGRSLRGLLRDASQTLAMAPDLNHRATHQKLFGKEGVPGLLRVGNAYLPEEVRQACQADHTLEARDFVTLIAATAIDNKTGAAKDHSLRFTEAAIPGLQFESKVALPEEYLNALATICALVRCLGANRYRGLGRCHMQIRHENAPKPTDYLAACTGEGE